MSGKKKIKRFLRDLERALERFKQATQVSLEENEFAVEATIQCFEFSFELYWKTLRVLLLDQGVDAGSPKQVLKEAYTLGWINNEQTWIDLLDARNITSHVYNEQRAQAIYELIREKAPMMHTEYAALKERFAHLMES